jgi:hypothetical protein
MSEKRFRIDRSLRSAYRNLRSQADEDHTDERERVEKGKKPWGVYESSILVYEKEFAPLFATDPKPEFAQEPRNISQFLLERRQQGLPRVALDMMSGTNALRGLDVEAGLAIALHDHRTPQQQSDDVTIHHVHMATGSLAEAKTWRRIDQWVKQKTQRDTFDLIMARPVAPISQFYPETDGVNHDFAVPYTMVQRLWNRLSRDGGMLVAEVPELGWSRTAHIIPSWIELCKSTSGIDLTYAHPEKHMPMLKLMRRHDSPEKLPLLP